jgi:putative ABC transport system permease protein
MSFWKIAWRNMKQRALASSLTGLSMALGVAVMICVMVIHSVTVKQFSQDAQGYHLIVGGNGGKNDLVLSTVFHVGTPLFPIPYAYYRDFTDGQYAELTKVAVPYCLGDSYAANGKLFRVVGVTSDLFNKIQYGTNQDGSPRVYEFAEGRNFEDDKPFEAVVGSMVAQQAGLKVGSTFNPTHGIAAEGDKHDAFKVVGVLAPTGTANDRAVFVNIEGFYLLAGHALSKPAEGIETPGPPDLAPEEELKGIVAQPILYDNDGAEVEPLAPELREVTSVLVLCNNAFGPNSLIYSINKDATRNMQAVAPGGVVTKLLEEIVGPVRVILLVLTTLIVIVAGVSILVSIYNSMNERSHDIAVMRALGASRLSVMLIVLFESILLSVAGGLAGIVLGHLIIGLAAPYVVQSTGVRLAVWEFDKWELVVIPALVVLASLAGFLPALSAYRTDVARALSGSR